MLTNKFVLGSPEIAYRKKLYGSYWQLVRRQWVDENLRYSTITTGGKADGLLTCAGVSVVKRSRYAHQVTLAALHTLSMDAFKSQSEFSDYSDWRQNLENESVTAKFWFTVIYMQVLLFIFVRSLPD